MVEKLRTKKSGKNGKFSSLHFKLGFQIWKHLLRAQSQQKKHIKLLINYWLAQSQS